MAVLLSSDLQLPWDDRQWLNMPEARKPKKVPTRYSSNLNNMMMACLTPDPRKRLTSLKLYKELRKML